tara:strand:+ start:391 stop:1317 length:927 start_codon:yes stop_codon:yes gene_type:complete
MNVLIFGATGFFGKEFVKKFYLDSSINLVLVNRDRKFMAQEIDNKTYDEMNSWDCSNIDLAIDFASNVSVDDFLSNPGALFIKNIEIAIKNTKILDRSNFKGKYIYISTDRALVDNKNVKYINKVLINNDPYGASKFVSEILISYFTTINDLRYAVVNFPNLYGPNQTSKQFIPTVLSKIDNSHSLVDIFSKKGDRNFLFIDDAVDALLKIVYDHDCNKNIQISGTNVKIEFLLNEIKKIYSNLNIDVNFKEKNNSNLSRREFSSPPKVMNDCLFREKYNWKPKISLSKGLQITINEYIKNKSENLNE